MILEQIAQAAAADAAAELAKAELDVKRLEEEAAAARETVAVHLTERAGLQAAVEKLPPFSPAISRLNGRLHELRHCEGPAVLAADRLTEAKRRVDDLQLELDQLRSLAAPPRLPPAEEEAPAQSVLEVQDVEIWP